MKKFSTFFLAVLCFCTFTNKTFGQFSSGDGSENNPYIITTPEQLKQLATYVNEGNATYNDKHYKLGNDIDLSDYQQGKGWNPIGYNQPFNGIFDGNNKVITNLKIAVEGNFSENYSGMFGYVSGVVKNLGVSVNISFTIYFIAATAGGVVGYNDGTVSNCYSMGLVRSSSSSQGSSSSYAGGVVGYNNGSVSNCYSTSVVSAKETSGGDSFAGGVVGKNNGSVLNCYSTGTVNSDAPYSYAGGLVGYNTGGSVSNCAALNPSMNCDANVECFGRIIGKHEAGTLTNNIAFDKMINPSGGTTWSNVGENKADGEDITVQAINADGTLGNRFTAANGWTTQNGKLPGFGSAVDMPTHLRLPGYPYITTTNLPDGAVGTAYNQTLTATSDTPVTWSLESGNLPTGLTLTAGGVILGVPSDAGIYKFVVKASNSVAFDTKNFVIYVFNEGCPLITTETLPNGNIGELYQQTLSVISDLPVTWSLESGNLPNGLALSSDGVILGVPTTNGLFTFTVKATNALGFDTKQLTIQIGNVGIVETDNSSSLRVYPNPTKGELIINSEQLTMNNVEVFDVMGRQVQRFEFNVSSSNPNPQTEINISVLPTGVYFIRIQTEDGTVTKKVVRN